MFGFVLGYLALKVTRRIFSDGLDARGRRPWNRALGDEQRAALAAGLDAFQNREAGVAIDWDVGRLTRSDPPGFVSLAAVAALFEPRPERLLEAPDDAVAEAIEELWGTQAEGVLRLDEAWYAPPIDDLSADRFAETAYDVLVSTLSPGLVSHAFDPLRGALTLGVEPPEQATYDSRVPTNELWVNLSLLLGEAHRRRAAGDVRDLAEILRDSLQSGVQEGAKGLTWLFGTASRAEKEVALACMQRRT